MERKMDTEKPRQAVDVSSLLTIIIIITPIIIIFINGI